MSRFFRSASSSSSSASEALSEDEDESLSGSQLITTNEQPSNRDIVSTATAITAGSGTSHRDLLLHALLEERCQRQAREELGPYADLDRVQRLAETQYRALSGRLAAYGLVEAGYDTSAYSTRRQAVRDGLDSLHGSGRAQQRGTELIRQQDTLQQLSIGVDTLQFFRPQIEPPRLPILPSMGLADTLLRLESPSVTSPSIPALLNGTRYFREFEEVSTLGRGGYGIVYHCKHRFDGLSYAVKKIPLSTSRLQRIRERGQAEVDHLLLELTTLARLDHPNIVRYYGGWVEFTSLGQQSITYDSDATFGASNHAVPSEASRSWRIADVEDNDFITFESSINESDKSSEQGTTLNRLSTRETQATVSDADVESIDRSLSPDLSTLSTFTQDAAPCLALHIQMSLYPFSLADYLSAAATAQHKHCFHLEPSLRILTALLDGITYLHAQGVVHRDLKPANVFLAQDVHKQGWCRRCSQPDFICTDGVRVRIGDFGLVAALASRDADDYTVPVGTELYRPLSEIDRGRLEALDWFALGIIAFELLWQFTTRMERHETLSALKSGLYPHTFDQRFGEQTSDVAKLIESLLRGQHAVDEIRTIIAAMLASC